MFRDRVMCVRSPFFYLVISAAITNKKESSTGSQAFHCIDVKHYAVMKNNFKRYLMDTNNKTNEIKAMPAYMPSLDRYVIEIYTHNTAVYLTRRQYAKLIWNIVLAACQLSKKNDDEE